MLSADLKTPGQDLHALRLRPGKFRQPYYLFVVNPDDRPRKFAVQLLDGDAPVKGAQVTLTVEAGATKPVHFGDAEPPAKDALPPLQGPLGWQLLDGDTNAVLDAQTIPVDVAAPREYVQVSEIRFDPGREPGKNLLSASLRTLQSVPGPDIPVEMVLSPARVPNLGGYKEATLTGVLKARPDKEAQPINLYARQLRLLPAEDENGQVAIHVDGYERAFLFRATFAREGDPVTPRGDGRPAIRLRSQRFAQATANTDVIVETDNAPAGSRVELSVGRRQGDVFEEETVYKRLTAKDRRLGFSPQGPGGALLFEASVRDWAIPLNTSKVLGRRLLRGRLLDENGGLIQEVFQELILDDTPPEGVKLLALPAEAQKGTILAVKAVGDDPESGIDRVYFFLGRLEDGKLPPKVVPIRAERVGPKSTVWTAKLPLPEVKGPQPITVMFHNAAGLSAHDTGTVELLDTDPAKTGLGRIEGKVVEGPRPQGDLEVVLRNLKDKELAKTKTKADGSFEFDKVYPGEYRVFSSKPASRRRGTAKATVKPKETTSVTVELALGL
jgi:hypothetical protein